MSQQVASRDGSIDGDPPAPPEPAPRRRRRRGWLAGIAAFAVLGSTVSAVAFLSRYQPLRVGSDSLGARPGGHWAGDNVWAIPFRNGATVTFGFSIRNEGSLGITITHVQGVAGYWPDTGRLRPIRVLVSSANPQSFVNTWDPAHFFSFRPFAMAPGTERLFLVQARFVFCSSVGQWDFLQYDSEPVGYRMLGFNHHTDVPLGVSIRVLGVANACPSG